MAITCQYSLHGQKVHEVPATHRVLGHKQPLHWDVYLALVENGEQPEFCLRHAGDVATTRNHPKERLSL